MCSYNAAAAVKAVLLLVQMHGPSQSLGGASLLPQQLCKHLPDLRCAVKACIWSKRNQCLSKTQYSAGSAISASYQSAQSIVLSKL